MRRGRFAFHVNDESTVLSEAYTLRLSTCLENNEKCCELTVEDRANSNIPVVASKLHQSGLLHQLAVYKHGTVQLDDY